MTDRDDEKMLIDVSSFGTRRRCKMPTEMDRPLARLLQRAAATAAVFLGAVATILLVRVGAGAFESEPPTIEPIDLTPAVEDATSTTASTTTTSTTTPVPAAPTTPSPPPPVVPPPPPIPHDDDDEDDEDDEDDYDEDDDHEWDDDDESDDDDRDDDDDD